MYSVYVLQGEKDGKLYIGCTSNLEERLRSHSQGRVRSTKGRLPIKLVYREMFDDRYEAFRTERFYKTPKGKKLLSEKMKLGDRLTVGQRPLKP